MASLMRRPRPGCWGGMSQWAHLDLDVLFERSDELAIAQFVSQPVEVTDPFVIVLHEL